MPLVINFADMEYTGVKIDRDTFMKDERRIARQLEDIEAKIYEFAGEKFNINSPKQLGVILFEKLSFQSLRKQKQAIPLQLMYWRN